MIHSLRDDPAVRRVGLLILLVIGAVSLVTCNPFYDPELAGTEEIDCMLAGQSAFEKICRAEKSTSPDGAVITVRAPDGEFRRFLIARDGAVAAADGAETVKVLATGSEGVDVLAGGIVWRLPDAMMR